MRLRDLTQLTEAHDVDMAFRFLLGRRLARTADAEFHLGKPLGKVLQHILNSTEFGEKVLPKLPPPGGSAPPGTLMTVQGETLINPSLRDWMGTRLDFSAARSRHWPGVLADWLLRPETLEDMGNAAIASLLRQRLESNAPLPGPAAAPPLSPPKPAAAPRPPTKQEGRLLALLRRMRALAKAGKRRDAVALARRSTVEFEGAPDGHLLLAEMLAAEADVAAARDALALARATAPGDDAVHLLAARLALIGGEWREADALFATHGTALPVPVLRLLRGASAPEAPEDLPGRYLRAALRREAPWEEPVAEALAELPEEVPPATVLQALALGFAEAEAVAEALAVLARGAGMTAGALIDTPDMEACAWLLLPGLALLPAEVEAGAARLCALALLALALGRPEAALAQAEAAMARAPTDNDVAMIRSLAFRRRDDYEGAVAALDALLARDPGHEGAIERLYLYEQEAARLDPLREPDRLERALTLRSSVLHRRLAVDQKSPALRLDLARLALARGQVTDARSVLDTLALEQPAWAAPRAQLLLLAQAENDHAGVLAHWEAMPEAARDEKAAVAAAKALRALDRIEEAQSLLEASLRYGGAWLRREIVRNHFFAGRFAEAASAAERLIAEQPGDAELRMLAAAAALELGDMETALAMAALIQAAGGVRHLPVELPLLFFAALARRGEFAAALAQLDPMFERMGARPVRHDARLGVALFDQLLGDRQPPAASGPYPPVFAGPLISVVMTTYNVAPYLRTAIRGILQQSYANLELIVVDDASTDGTPAILERLERTDPRLRVILKTTNDGTYVSKNMGLMQARGDFVALQDADDWSHPDRLAVSLGVLLRRPDLMGLTTDWLRMTTPGGIVVKAGGQISHLCCISLVFRREPVLERIGFFDSVRVAADLEFIQRMQLGFGPRAVPRLRWPLLFGRARSDSLTANEEFGISRTVFTATRTAYHAAADVFHARIAAGEAELRMPFPLRDRRFPAPATIMPNAGR